MTYLAKPVLYDQAGFQHLISTLSWHKGWKPLFPTLHNTGAPTLAQYEAYSPAAHDAWGSNLDRYYKGLGWHSGPHLVACPDGILNLCDLEQDGVSVSCWNHLTIGIEMTGDFDREAFDTGDGAKVRDNAVFALAVLSNKLGWHPDPLVTGKSGLHFHRMCTQDHHSCPGKNVVRGDVVARVSAKMQALRGSSIVVADHGDSPPVAPTFTIPMAQAALNAAGAQPHLLVDGQLGPETAEAIRTFQAARGIAQDGTLNAVTIAALQSMAVDDPTKMGRV